ncbi:Uncharacterised protein [Chlamydia trachomatis]|nr:Uncharacterised protein [Chlamydia trachomatis]CRI74516.1 Uncharacterised protein [Chlamydia trachomatis]
MREHRGGAIKNLFSKNSGRAQFCKLSAMCVQESSESRSVPISFGVARLVEILVARRSKSRTQDN